MQTIINSIKQEIDATINKMQHDSSFDHASTIDTLIQQVNTLTNVCSTTDVQLQAASEDVKHANDIIPWERNWYVFNNNEDNWSTNLATSLQSYGLDKTKLDTVLRRYQAVIAGGFALNLWKPNSTQGDLDIFIPVLTKEEWMTIKDANPVKRTNFESDNNLQHLLKPSLDFTNMLYEAGYTQKNHAAHLSFLACRKDPDGDAVKDHYEQVKHVVQVQTLVRPDIEKTVQLIFVGYFSAKSHVRNFDISACQTLYDGRIFCTRAKYYTWTKNDCMLLLKQASLDEDQKFCARVLKYIQRGFIPVSEFAYHLINKQNIHVVPKVNIQLPCAPSEVKMVNKTISMLEPIARMLDPTSANFDLFKVAGSLSNALSVYQHSDRISNEFKDKFLAILVQYIDALEKKPTLDRQYAKAHIHKDLLCQVFKTKDIRWLLLFFEGCNGGMKHQWFRVETQDLVTAQNTGVARDNLLIIKRLLRQQLEAELDRVVVQNQVDVV